MTDCFHSLFRYEISEITSEENKHAEIQESPQIAKVKGKELPTRLSFLVSKVSLDLHLPEDYPI